MRAARDARARRGRRLRARRAVAALGRRHPRAAARCARERARRAHRALHRHGVGSRARDRQQRAHGRPVHRGSIARRDRADVAARGASHRRQHGALRALHVALPRGARRARVLPGEGARNAPAPREVPGHAVQPRAEREGKPRRPARSADDPLDRARGGLRQQLARARHARAHHRSRSARAAPQRRLPENAARAAARDRRAAPGHPRVRSADAGGRELRLPADVREARERAADAALLLGREGGHAARDDPDPEHRGAALPGDERRHARAVARALRREAGHARDRRGRRVRAPPGRDPRSRSCCTRRRAA